MTVVTRPHPVRGDLGDPDSFYGRHKRPLIGAGALALLGILVAAGFVFRPSDYVRADVQAQRDARQDERVAEHERRITLVEDDVRQGLRAILERLPEPKKGKR